MDDVRELLEAERARVRTRLAGLDADHRDVVDASLDSNADDEHDPEGATIAFERSQIDSLARQAREHLAEIDAALTRLEGGRFGICERCGQPVPTARLRARPTARRCVGCT